MTHLYIKQKMWGIQELSQWDDARIENLYQLEDESYQELCRCVDKRNQELP